MTVPDFQSLMLPLLRFAIEKGCETSTNEAVEVLSNRFGLSNYDL